MTYEQATAVRFAIQYGERGTITANLWTALVAHECIDLGFLELTGDRDWFVIGWCPMARVTRAGIEALRQYDLENLINEQDAILSGVTA